MLADTLFMIQPLYMIIDHHKSVKSLVGSPWSSSDDGAWLAGYWHPVPRGHLGAAHSYGAIFGGLEAWSTKMASSGPDTLKSIIMKDLEDVTT